MADVSDAFMFRLAADKLIALSTLYTPREYSLRSCK